MSFSPANSNGFGPVSKLTTIANLLSGIERIFVGDAGAYEYARQNNGSYEQLFTIAEFWNRRDIVSSCDLAIVVMEPDVAFDLVQSGVPVYLFDSLLDFWVLPDGVEPLIEATRAIQNLSTAEGRAVFHTFTIHERKVLAHLLATRAFAQNFPGVPQRIEELKIDGVQKITLLGPIIDIPDKDGSPLHSADATSWSMLINLGGVQNFAIEFHKNDYIIDLMEKWAERFLVKEPNCREIILCCGRYDRPSVRRVGNGVLTLKFAAHDDFVAMMARTDVLLTSPGRTTLAEAVHLARIPILLPEQHYNQYLNMDALIQAGLGSLVVPLSDVVDLGKLPDDDVRGTELILECTRRVLQSDQLFDRFDGLLSEKINEVRSMAADEKERLIVALSRFFCGQDFTQTVHGLILNSRLVTDGVSQDLART